MKQESRSEGYDGTTKVLRRDWDSGIRQVYRRDSEGPGFFPGAIGSKRRRGGQAFGKLPYLPVHAGMPETLEVKCIPPRERLAGRPMFEGQAESSDEHTGAIASEVTVDKDGVLRALSEEGEKLSHLLVGGRRPSVAGNKHELHAERMRFLKFALACAARLAA